MDKIQQSLENCLRCINSDSSNYRPSYLSCYLNPSYQWSVLYKRIKKFKRINKPYNIKLLRNKIVQRSSVLNVVECRR